ncbi:hypothetical protein SAMN06265222_102162 [Neorhodopirellula lusitana]|uniref:Uncharacterized protein n=1 Tax=Neorhodopirellula lusitana TaxID=445327 RepID=A0ABY1PWV0_9BACT|nr:hypothetical protein SAMN06265222_102162 [Neorhodopirellula lusitana]
MINRRKPSIRYTYRAFFRENKLAHSPHKAALTCRKIEMEQVDASDAQPKVGIAEGERASGLGFLSTGPNASALKPSYALDQHHRRASGFRFRKAISLESKIRQSFH